jgi:hypothetical protein
VICRLEWDRLAGPMYPRIPIPTLVFPTQPGAGGVAGEVAGVAGAAGAGLHPTVIPGGKNMKQNFLKEVKHA